MDLSDLGRVYGTITKNAQHYGVIAQLAKTILAKAQQHGYNLDYSENNKAKVTNASISKNGNTFVFRALANDDGTATYQLYPKQQTTGYDQPITQEEVEKRLKQWSSN